MAASPGELGVDPVNVPAEGVVDDVLDASVAASTTAPVLLVNETAASNGVAFRVGSASMLKKITSPASAQNLNRSRSPTGGDPPGWTKPEKNRFVAELATAIDVPLGSVSAVADDAA